MVALKHRLKRLEKIVAPKVQKESFNTIQETWLVWCGELAKEGFFDGEPDFPTALEEFRQAIGAAKKRTDPPFFPPRDFRPVDRCNTEEDRIYHWRRRHVYPGLEEAFNWIFAMWLRINEKKPGVTVAEINELTAWFEGNESRCKKTVDGRLHLGGMAMPPQRFRYLLKFGHRSKYVTEVVEMLRDLRAFNRDLED